MQLSITKTQILKRMNWNSVTWSGLILSSWALGCIEAQMFLEENEGLNASRGVCRIKCFLGRMKRMGTNFFHLKFTPLECLSALLVYLVVKLFFREDLIISDYI